MADIFVLDKGPALCHVSKAMPALSPDWFWTCSQFLVLLKGVYQLIWTTSPLRTHTALSCLRAEHIPWPHHRQFFPCSFSFSLAEQNFFTEPPVITLSDVAEPPQHCFLSQHYLLFFFFPEHYRMCSYWLTCLFTSGRFLPLGLKAQGRYVPYPLHSPLFLKAWRGARYAVELYKCPWMFEQSEDWRLSFIPYLHLTWLYIRNMSYIHHKNQAVQGF